MYCVHFTGCMFSAIIWTMKEVMHLNDEYNPIKYDKLFALMAQRGLTTYQIRQKKILGQGTLQRLREGGYVSTQVIGRLCEELKCQPGDILEYVPKDTKTPQD